MSPVDQNETRANCSRKVERLNLDRLEICQKIYTTGFSGQKFFTLKVRNATIFTQRETAYMHLYQLLVAFLLKF